MTYFRLSLRYLLATISIIILSFALFFVIKEVLAWTNPTQAPPGGSGLITVSGSNVGIGTTSPASKLHVSNSGSIESNLILEATPIGNGDAQIHFRTNSNANLAMIGLNDDQASSLVFKAGSTNPDTGSGGPHMVITAAGNVGIGTPSPGSKLEIKQVSGSGFLKLIDTNAPLNHRDIYLYANTSLMGFDNGSNIANLTAAGVWADASDISYKENISSLDYGLDTILQIQPKRYNVKVDGSEQIGFIAQEIEPIVPEIVSGADGNKNIAYGHLTPILVNAIKELNQKVDAFTQSAARVVNLVADRLTVGSSEKPTGITIFDKETRDPYCLEIISGSVKTNKGECQ